MKATGIVRRIDDLGRVVVPKEIRRTLRIREGDPLLTTLSENVDTYGKLGKECYFREMFMWGIGRLAERMGIKSGKVTNLTIGVSYGRIWKESNKFK